jgi:hypothetical protein
VSNYTKSTNFAAKDSLPSGSAGKVVKGTEINTEFDNIATAISSKIDMVTPGPSGNVLTSNGTTWVSASSANSGVVRSVRTSNTILGIADEGTLVAITSGTFTQTFTAAATLGSGWYCYIQNLGTGDITLDPNGSETIDGLTSYIMYSNEIRLVQCDGSNFFTVVVQPFYKTFTSTGSFTFPPGYGSYGGVVIGAGGGGQGGLGWTAGNTRGGGSGGGGGGLVPFAGLIATAGSTVTATVGAGSNGSAGGTGGTPASVPSAGGSSSLGNYVTATGGNGSGSGGGASANRVSYFSGVDATTTYTFGGSTEVSNSFGTFGAAQVAAGNVSPTTARGGGSEYGGSGGGKNGSSAAAMSAGGQSLFGPTGAGSGGGVSSGNSAWDGSAGGGVGYSNTPSQAGGGASGGSGAAGSAGSVLGSIYAPGGGGGGGGGNAAGTGYAGGAGAAPGGGGGGGGGGLTTGGAGGNGARGEVRVWGCA